GAAPKAAAAYTDLATIAAFDSVTGKIQVRNGGSYITTIAYTGGITYHFRLDINIPTHTYSAYATPAGSIEQTLGTNLAFRTEQNTVTQLSYFSYLATTGSTNICNLTTSAISTPTPTPTPSYAYTQSSYYAYSQSAYYAYAQSSYYVYSQSPYYAYSQSAYTSGTNYYVSPTGNDSNNGSASSPWKTIQHAASVVTAGYTVHVAPGTYTEQVTISNSGTALSRIRFVSDTKWGALMRGTNICRGAFFVTGSYVDIIGFDISNGAYTC